MFDSLYSSVDGATTKFLTNLFGLSISQMVDSPHQAGATDCGLYVIATCVVLVNYKKPGKFIKENMRAHLVTCFENYFLTLFPC